MLLVFCLFDLGFGFWRRVSVNVAQADLTLYPWSPEYRDESLEQGIWQPGNKEKALLLPYYDSLCSGIYSLGDGTLKAHRVQYTVFSEPKPLIMIVMYF